MNVTDFMAFSPAVLTDFVNWFVMSNSLKKGERVCGKHNCQKHYWQFCSCFQLLGLSRVTQTDMKPLTFA